MKTVSNLTGTPSDTTTAIPHVGRQALNTQSQRGFWRTIKHSKNVISLESSSGGSVQIPIAELWKLGEANDDKLKTPTPLTK